MKKRLCIMTLLFVFILCGCDGGSKRTDDADYDDSIVVGFSQVGAESDWRNANTKSMMEAFSEENGYRLIIDDAQQKQEKQITAIRNFIHQGVDYIVLAPTTENGWDTVLQEAKAAGINVIIVDRMINVSDDGLFTCWIGSDFKKEGDEAVAWMDKHLKGQELKILHLQGNIGSSAQLGRTAGLDEGVKNHPEWEIVFRDSGDFTQAKGQELVEAVLAQGISFNVIFSENDNMAYGAIEAIKAAGIRPVEDVTIISFDANRTALNMILAREISLDVECNPLHGPRVQTLIEMLERGEIPPKFTYVEETAFDIDSLSEEIIRKRGY